MANILLTDKALRSLKPQKGTRQYIWDSRLPGFGVRLEVSGTKSFVLKYRFKGQQRMVTIDQFPRCSLADARSQAHAILGRSHEGIDPNHTDLLPAKTDRFDSVLESYIEKHCAKSVRQNTRDEVERVLRKEFLPSWRQRDITEIRKSDVVAILDGIMARGAPSAANHALAYINQLFNWAVARGVIEASPSTGIASPAAKKSRERVLADVELGKIWKAAEQTGYPFGAIVQLLILTGQRRGEVASVHWEHLDLDNAIWTLPGEFTKNKREHLVPLSPKAMDVLTRLPRTSSHFVFPARSNSSAPFSGFSKCKRRLSEVCSIAPWTLHDLRRTTATGLAKLEVDPHVIERALNHVSGSFAGVAGTYNRYAYLDETRDALCLWAEHVSKIAANSAGE